MAKNEDRIYLAVDGDNFFHLQKSMGWWVDPQKLKEYVATYGNIVEANYYLSVHDGRSASKDRFIKALSHIGYCVVPRLVKHVTRGDGSIKEKSNLDVQIALDSALALEHFDIYFLVSGDSDFGPVAKAFKTRGKRVWVISAASVVSRELREITGQNYVDFESIKGVVEKERVEEVD